MSKLYLIKLHQDEEGTWTAYLDDKVKSACFVNPVTALYNITETLYDFNFEEGIMSIPRAPQFIDPSPTRTRMQPSGSWRSPINPEEICDAPASCANGTNANIEANARW